MSAMPFGRYKSVPLSEIPSGYLEWLHGKVAEWYNPSGNAASRVSPLEWLHGKVAEWYPPLRQAVLAEVARRASVPPESPMLVLPPGRTPPATSPPPSVLVLDAGAVIDAGERALASRWVGDPAQMKILGALVGRLRQLAGAAGLVADDEVPS